MNASLANYTSVNFSRGGRGLEGGVGEVRRHVERLLLRLDFNSEFSKRQGSPAKAGDILGEGGIL